MTTKPKSQKNDNELKIKIGKINVNINSLNAVKKFFRILMPIIYLFMGFAVFFNDEAKAIMGIFSPTSTKETKIIENKDEVQFTSETVIQIIKNFHTEVIKLQQGVNEDAQENNEELKSEIRQILNIKLDLMKDELLDDLLKEMRKTKSMVIHHDSLSTLSTLKVDTNLSTLKLPNSF